MKDTQKFGGAGETLEVIFGDKLVGLLRRRSEGIQDIEFVYDDAWTADPQAFAVSTRMPLAQRVHEPGVVYRWFLNLLPEGRTLATVGTIPKIPEADVFALLGELGEGLPGALEVYRPADRRPAQTTLSRLTEAEFAKRSADFRRNRFSSAKRASTCPWPARRTNFQSSDTQTVASASRSTERL
ncbi:HipA-like protein [Bradyrhizobium sp. USDA 4501]